MKIKYNLLFDIIHILKKIRCHSKTQLVQMVVLTLMLYHLLEELFTFLSNKKLSQ
jgi:hypothetical protein